MALSRFKRLQDKTPNIIASSLECTILSSNRVTGWSVNFPIGATCQPSKLCAETCYGLKGPITWSSALRKQVRNLAWCRNDPVAFAERLEVECTKILAKDPGFYLRWNGVGDLFQESVNALKELNRRLPKMPIWCVTRIPRFAIQLANLQNLWVHFSFDKSSIERYSQMSRYSSDMRNLFFSYQCDSDEHLEELPVDVGVLFFDGYKIKEPNRQWSQSPITCPLNFKADISGTCSYCRRCFDGKAVEFSRNPQKIAKSFK